LGRIEQKIDDLGGNDGRVARLEKAQERHWWFTVCIAPSLAILHGLARKFGVDI
jgi:hypothetical protein